MRTFVQYAANDPKEPSADPGDLLTGMQFVVGA
jgi:hypothetical protein